MAWNTSYDALNLQNQRFSVSRSQFNSIVPVRVLPHTQTISHQICFSKLNIQLVDILMKLFWRLHQHKHIRNLKAIICFFNLSVTWIENCVHINQLSVKSIIFKLILNYCYNNQIYLNIRTRSLEREWNH